MTLNVRRSALYMPGANARAQEKARTLQCDVVIFDLEDATAADAKGDARRTVAGSLKAGGYGERELVVRVNGFDTPWGEEDAAAVLEMKPDAVLIPKVEQRDQLDAWAHRLGSAQPLWAMVETPLGVMNVEAIARHESVQVLVMGTSDLIADLRARHRDDRSNLRYALQRCVLAARAAGVDILDGVHLAYQDAESFAAVCLDGRDMGMDGKTLIHPTQIDVANQVFGVSSEAVAHARRVMEVWAQAQSQGRGVAVLDGQLVENLHVREAERTLALAAAAERHALD